MSCLEPGTSWMGHHSSSSTPITLPAYEVLNLSMEYLAVEDLLDFVLFDAIANNWGWWWWVAFLTFGD